jgi:hypothetical protein
MTTQYIVNMYMYGTYGSAVTVSRVCDTEVEPAPLPRLGGGASKGGVI